MSVLFPFSAPAPRNASFEVFLLCQLCCGVEVPYLFSAKPVRNRVHSYHCSGYKCIFFSFFYTFPPSFDALSGSLRPAQICPRVISLRSSLWHSYLSLSVPLTTSTPVPLSLPPSLSLSLSLSLSFPSSYSFPSQWRPSSQSASVTLLQDVHVELWPQEPGLPKTVTWFKVANKLAANYLSNTCWRRCWEAPLTKEQLAKETRRGHFHLTRNHYLTTPCLFSAPGESVNIITYHHLLGCDTDPKWRVSCHTRRSLRDK